MAVHVLGGGVGDDVGAPLKGTAVNGGGEGVVHDQGNAVGVSSLGKLLDIQHRQGGVGDGLAENGLGVGTESGVQLFLGAVGVDKGHFQTHPLHGDGEQIEAAAVNGGAGNDMVTAACNIEHGHEVGSLTGAGQHSGGAAFQRRDFGGHHIAGGVL